MDIYKFHLVVKKYKEDVYNSIFDSLIPQNRKKYTIIKYEFIPITSYR